MRDSAPRTQPLLLLSAVLLAASVSVFAAESAAAGEQVPAAPASETDAAARFYLDRCAGCHSLGGPTRSGPDLLASTAWKPADLTAAIERMQKNTGPISISENEALVSLLKDPALRDRVTVEESREALRAAAALEPPSAALGRALYHGEKRFANGGASCVSCHAFHGRGGTLGPPLDTVHARMGSVALASAIEKSAFNVMRPIYAKHPVTKQESVHVAAYLETAPPQTPPRIPPVGGVALGLSVAALAVLGFKRRSGGTRARLVAEATRR